MNIINLFEKVQSFSLKLKELKDLIKSSNDETSAKALKELLHFPLDNREGTKELLTNMRICLKNKARLWAQKPGVENYRKIGLAKSLVETISSDDKISGKPKETLINYSNSLNEYLEYKKTKSKKFDAKKVEKSFQTIRKNILDSFNESCFNDFEENLKVFKELVVSNSKKEELEVEIEEIWRPGYYYDYRVEWLKSYEDNEIYKRNYNRGWW